MPPIGAVIEASIFIASMVATGCPAATSSPAATDSETTPANGAATCPGWVVSARSAAATCTVIERSRTRTGRNCPFRVHITRRMPRSSASLIESSAAMIRRPRSSSITCSSPGRRP